MRVSLESEFKLRNLLIENEDAEGLLYTYDPKVIDLVLWVTVYPNSISLKMSMHPLHIDVKHSFKTTL